MDDDKIVTDVCIYIALCARFPQSIDWQKRVDDLWDYCLQHGKTNLYKRGYDLAAQQVGLAS